MSPQSDTITEFCISLVPDIDSHPFFCGISKVIFESGFYIQIKQSLKEVNKMLSLYVKFTNFISGLLHKEDGVTAVEYALIAAAIVIAIGVAVKLIGTNSSATFNSVATAV